MIQETSFNLQTEINTNQDKVPDNCEFIMLSRIHIPKLLYQREFETAGSCKKKKTAPGNGKLQEQCEDGLRYT